MSHAFTDDGRASKMLAIKARFKDCDDLYAERLETLDMLKEWAVTAGNKPCSDSVDRFIAFIKQ